MDMLAPEHVHPLVVEALGQVLVPAQEIFGEDVGADFFVGAGLHQQVSEVLPLALLRRLLVVVLVEPRRHPALEGQREHRRAQRQHHQHPVETRQQPRHQDDGDDVAGEPQDGPGEVARAPRHIALGPRQPVVPVGVVEVPHVESRALGQEAALGLELHAPHKELAAVAGVGAEGALNAGGEPEPDDGRHHVAEMELLRPRLGDLIHQARAEVHHDRRERGAQDAQHRIADQRAR
jgi:hypothetical protein